MSGGRSGQTWTLMATAQEWIFEHAGLKLSPTPSRDQHTPDAGLGAGSMIWRIRDLFYRVAGPVLIFSIGFGMGLVIAVALNR